MAEFNELKKRYEAIPIELQRQKRWICFALRTRNGESIKIPVSPMSNGESIGALSDDESSWGTFDEALRYCAKNNLDGIGYEFGGSGMVGIDIKNNKDANGNPFMSEMEFRAMSNDFVKTLNSYTEWSVSKNGIHIIISGKLPQIANKNPCIEIHDGNRYFAMTGDTIGKRGISNRTNELETLIVRYGLTKEQAAEEEEVNADDNSLESLSDSEVMKRVMKSKNAEKFQRLMEGSQEGYPSKGEAMQGLCNFLAYYTNCDEKQIDRMFRTSKFYCESWEENGPKFIQKAIETCAALLVKTSQSEEPAEQEMKQEPKLPKKNLMNLDKDGEPIFRMPQGDLKKSYSLDDTGNAQMFYDYYGENFRWNSTDKVFMFWTGKTWVVDVNEIIRKYANNLIDIMKQEAKQFKDRVDNEDNEILKKELQFVYFAMERNIKKISNKSGKDAMLSEFRTIKGTSVENSVFNRNPYLLNTDSGIVDLRNGEIHDFDKDKMLSYNTKIKVSFEEPVVWIDFLRTIFDCGDPQKTDAIIECLQRCLGYTLTGLTWEQCMFLLHGDGSNGKSTMSNVLQDIMGDYFSTIDSGQLMAKKNQNVAVQNSMAELIGIRYLCTSETEENERLSEKTVKEITGGDQINAQKKYGKPFHYRPVFKTWMMTNNLPIIRGKDYGIWRRVFLFTFKKQFKDEEKDKEMPDKLKAEYPKILGWCIKGAVKYIAEKDLKQPQVLRDELGNFRKSLDTVLMFLDSECTKNALRAEPKKVVYEAYNRWCFISKLPAMSQPKFQIDMEKKGFKIINIGENQAQYYDGLILRNSEFPTSITVSKNKDEDPFDDDSDW